MRNAVTSSGDDDEPTPRRQLDRRQPFVLDPRRVVYPVDYSTTQQAAVARFQAEVRIVVGGQLTRRAIREATELERLIRSQAHDEAEYAALEMLSMSYIGAAIQVRDTYMGVDQRRGYR
jgi:hypothetical protein